ncbi:beta-galactosidase trimerization domain-containing protein [Crossiella sp. SN42]|uniref:alpha-amylase family protein n=1 Tax=Crossiella sp. SN42 TaxID=2944808 RepID=UPI00207C558C|nr:alpha-amylase family protein [Crossiella sp. SN42]MCO1579491.1 beta-galactosidase trimerization domain-containing protein [Crossiella sp. SN42]
MSDGQPWRKVILDFNNSPEVHGVGAGFDPAEFAATLRAAHVEAVVVVAKDVQGNCYFPSARPGPATWDLLRGQVEACRAANLRVQALYPFAWDEHLAQRHPEWLVMRRDRRTGLPPVGEVPDVSQLCLSHPGLLEVALTHTGEILRQCAVDGMWFDMVNPGPLSVAECYCARCLAEHVRSIRPEVQVTCNTLAVLGSADRVSTVDTIEIEGMATGVWGYGYLPVHARYARTLGRPVYGMPGRFATQWGDYGGLKHPLQLRTELAGIVANGLRCDIGDDPGPALRLDPAVYATIGEAYAEIERIQPYLEGAVPVTEAAILADGPPLTQFGVDGGGAEDGWLADQLAEGLDAFVEGFVRGAGVAGAARLLMERQLQFDIVDLTADFERYRLLVLPELLTVDAGLAARLNRYLDAGGAVLASHGALRVGESAELWPAGLSGRYHGEAEFERPYTSISGPILGDDQRYAGYDFALYEGCARWTVGPGVTVHARLTEPTADPVHLTGYAVPPSGVVSEYATAVQAPGLGALAFPLGRSYLNHGYWIYRELTARLLDGLLPEPLVRTTAPASAEVTLTHQPRTATGPERWIVHLVNHSPLRAPRGRVEFLEDPIPLRDIEIALAADLAVTRAAEVRCGVELPVRRTGDRWCVTVPETRVAATVVFEG